MKQLGEGTRSLCASTKPNSKLDTYSLSVPAINDNTDR